MTTLTEIRAKFPQYQDLSDKQLTDALYSKFYSDMPRQDFDAKVGVTNAAEQAANEGLDIVKAGIPGYTAIAERVQQRNEVRSQREAEARRKFLEGRDPLTRLGSAAAFFADVPVRAFTQGRLGVGDVLEGVGSQSGAASVRKAQGDFVRANPDLVWGMGAAGEVGAAIPALSTMGALGRVPPGYSMRGQLNAMRAQNAATDLAAFERQGVRPPAPAFMAPAGRNAAAGLSETFAVGAPLASAMDDSLMGVARASGNIANRYGSAPLGEQAGRVVRQGLERYKDERGILPPNLPQGASPQVVRSRTIAAPTRDTSMKTKQTALYDKAWDYIPEWMRGGGSRGGESRLMIQFPRTRQLLSQLQTRNQRMVVGGDGAPIIETGGFTSNVINALMNQRWSASLDTARNIRSRFRRMISSLPENERNALSRSDIQRLESTLSQDIVNGMIGLQARLRQNGRTQDAASVGRAIHSFRRADQYTRASFERLDRVAKLFNAPDDAALYRGIVTAAKQGDMSKISSLRQMLSRSEMDELSSSLISQMGTPVASARGVVADVGFSPSTFATNWNKLVETNPRALNLLFPNRTHRQALTDLARMAERLSSVEAMRNTSRSATTAANIGMITGGGATYAAGGLETLLAGAVSGLAFSTLLSRPVTARWLVRYAQLKSAASNSPAMVPQLQAHVATLGALAAKDTALAPIYQDILKNVDGAR